MRTIIPSSIKKTLLSALVMVLIFIIAGVIYVWYTGRQTPKPVKTNVNKAPASLGLPKALKPAANAPEGVAIESLLSPVKAGENTSYTVRTNPTSTCTLAVNYNGVASHDSGLGPKAADPYGFVTWTWTVEPNVPAGTYPATATCAYNGRTGVAVAHLEVTSD